MPFRPTGSIELDNQTPYQVLLVLFGKNVALHAANHSAAVRSMLFRLVFARRIIGATAVNALAIMGQTRVGLVIAMLRHFTFMMCFAVWGLGKGWNLPDAWNSHMHGDTGCKLSARTH